MIINLLAKAFLFYIVYLGIRSLMDKFSSDKSNNVTHERKKSQSFNRGARNSEDAIEADYRVVD